MKTGSTKFTEKFTTCEPGPGKCFEIALVIIPISIIDGTIGFHILFLGIIMLDI